MFEVTIGPVVTPDVQAARQVLERVFASRNRFHGATGETSRKIGACLLDRFCEGGNATSEREIGERFFPTVDPSMDATVRRAVRRLDRVFSDYFAEEGYREQLRVRIPLQRYQLEFYCI